ncbi:hypothetical protein D3C75_844980 [compost metagenome]
MRTSLSYLTLLHHDNQIHVDHPVQPVGCQEHQFPLKQRKHRFLKLIFSLNIKMGRRLIEQHHRTAAQQCPGQRNTLFLSAAE